MSVFSFEKEDVEPESDHEEEEPHEGEAPQEAMRKEFDGLLRKYHCLEACKTGPRENPSLIAAMNKELRHMRHVDTNMKQSLNTVMLHAKIKSRASCPDRDVVVANQRANLAKKIDKHLNSNIDVIDSLMHKSAVVQHDLEMCRRKLGGENNKKEMIHQVEKKIKLLDNRLHRSQLNFCQSLTLNRYGMLPYFTLKQSSHSCSQKATTFHRIYGERASYGFIDTPAAGDRPEQEETMHFKDPSNIRERQRGKTTSVDGGAR